MALAQSKKIQIIALDKEREKVLETLQNFGAVDIQDAKNEQEHEEKALKSTQEKELDHANLEFAINFLSQFEEKKGLLPNPITLTIEEAKEKTANSKYQTLVEESQELDNNITKGKNLIASYKNEIQGYKQWKKLNIDIANLSGTKTTEVLLGAVKSSTFKELKAEIEEVSKLLEITAVSEDPKTTQFWIIFNKELKKSILTILTKHKYNNIDIPAEEGLVEDKIRDLKANIEKTEDSIEDSLKKAKKLAKNLDDLKIAYDYIGWEKDKAETNLKLENTDHTLIITAWTPKKNFAQLEKKLEKTTKHVAIAEIEPEEGEVPPVMLKNGSVMSPFESLTKMYGLPKHTELDPTPFLSIFFVIFFALCLTDAGYGLIMFAVMAGVVKFVKLPEGMKKFAKLLMYAGFFTFIIGILFGGWFGLETDQVPASLTYENSNGDQLFLGQIVSSIISPITVLILALGLGYAQILLGVMMKFVHDFRTQDKKAAVLDTGTWVFMLTGIGSMILTKAGVLPAALDPITTGWVLLAAVILVLTQGRDKKNIIAKFLAGVLSLYNLVGYLSDILSYSRLLALGLATAIIGLAVNVIAALMIDLIPYVGIVFAVIVFVGGHLFNMVINALGSFIHSGRLQFVEFFRTFMEGGGKELKPFSKKCKYTLLKNNS